MLTIMIFKALRKTYKQKYFIEILLLLIVLTAGIVTFFQYEFMETYKKQEDTDTFKTHDLRLQNLYDQYTNNNQWQPLRRTSHNKLHVYSAYYDNRENKNLIRIIGLSEPHFSDDIQCQLYFQNSETELEFVSATVEPLDEDVEAELVAVFVTCALPEGLPIPRAVAVTAGSELMISNLLLVQNLLPRTKYAESMVVCVEPLENNYSQSIRLMEFIELNNIMGVDHFIFYKQAVSESFQCLLSDYVKQGRVTVMGWNIPREETNPTSKTQHEGNLAAFNDCLYQTMSKYEYTAFLSIDEFIIPKEAKSLKDLIRAKETRSYHNNTGAYIFKVANFYLEWPDEEWRGSNYLGLFLTSVYKTYQTTTDSNRSTKSVCKPKAVVQVGTQNDMRLISGYYSTDVEELQGLCHRYRLAPSDHSPPPVAQALRDVSAIRFAPRLITAVGKQYQISMPHCSLSHGAGNVKIRLFGPNRTPLLMDNLVA